MTAPALLALLCVAQAPSARGVEATADQLTITPSTHAWAFHGHARLSTDALVLRADELTYDPEAQRAKAEGDVVFSSGLYGGTALRLDVDLRREEGIFQGATLYAKGHATPAAIAAARTPDEMHLVGKNELTLRADELRRLGPDLFDAEGLYLTVCDCKSTDWETEPPSWSIRAKRARIDAGHSVRLSWATLYIKEVPVMPLPILLLPLSNRQTGFLLPRPAITANNGFQLEEPFFWAISRSYDATFTPGYYFGTGGDIGMRGPRLGGEFRYVPSTDTHGRVNLALVEDLKGGFDGRRRGPRGELAVSHVQTLGGGWEDRVDLAAISDQQYFRDVTADVVAASASYLRSDARVERRGDSTDFYVTGSDYQALTMLNLADGGAPAGSLGPFFGPNDVNRFTFQRMPAFGLSVLEGSWGPLRARVSADGAAYEPFSTAGLPDCAQTEAGGIIDPACALEAQRQPLQRVGVAPELRLPLQLGSIAELDPYLYMRGDAWAAEPRAGADVTSSRALSVVGAQLQTELARTFEDSSGVKWRHVIAPVLEVRGMPWSAGSMPAVNGLYVPADEWDAPVADRELGLLGTSSTGPLTGFGGVATPPLFQGVAAVRTRLQRKEGASVTEPFSAELGQGYDLAAGEPADSYARAALSRGPLSTSGEVRYSSEQRRIAGLGARAGWNAPGGSGLSVGYARLRTFLTDPMNAGVLDLVGPPGPPGRTSADPTVLAERLDVAARWRVSTGLGLDAGLSFLPHARLLDAFAENQGEPSAPWRRLLQYSAGVNYGSPCDCWALRASFMNQPSPGKLFNPNFFFVLDAHRLGGSFGG